MDKNMEEIDEQLENQISAEPAHETEIDKDARNWSVVCHLSAFLVFLGIPLGNILGPLAIWLIKRNDYAFVDDQGKAALNFQISITLYVIIIAVFGFGLLFLRPHGFSANIGSIMINIGPYMFLIALVSFAIEIAYAALIVIAAIKSNKGIFYRYPLTIEFLK